MTIYELIEKYGKGKGEAVMIESTRILSDVLEPMKEKEPKKYWLALRKLYGAMSGCHYNEEFAMHDVADMEYTDKEGNEHKGGYWTVDQIEEATKNKNFPSGCTRWDKYVAFNAFWTDLCKVLDGEDIIEAAYAFWFDDEDWMQGDNKIWSYMCLKYSYE